MVTTVVTLLILSILVEAVWETISTMFGTAIDWVKDRLPEVDKIGAAVVAVVLCLGTGANLFEVFDIDVNIPYLGAILTGLLISRGSNFLHDLIASLENYRKRKEI